MDLQRSKPQAPEGSSPATIVSFSLHLHVTLGHPTKKTAAVVVAVAAGQCLLLG